MILRNFTKVIFKRIKKDNIKCPLHNTNQKCRSCFFFGRLFNPRVHAWKPEHQKDLAEIPSRERRQHSKPLWPQDLIKIFILCAHMEVRYLGPSVHPGLVDNMSCSPDLLWGCRLAGQSEFFLQLLFFIRLSEILKVTHVHGINMQSTDIKLRSPQDRGSNSGSALTAL